MKVKIVLSLFASMLLLVSCGSKNDQDSSVKTDDSTTQQGEEEFIPTSSTIGGGQGTPEESVDIFRN